jgi:ribosomal protein L12E/L44/L45/RPP1/RPP2
MTTTTRDFAAEYIAARKIVRSAANLTARGLAEQDARRILLASQVADENLNEVVLDEHARQELAAAAPAPKVERIIGYTMTGLPIWG